MARGRWADTL